MSKKQASTKDMTHRYTPSKEEYANHCRAHSWHRSWRTVCIEAMRESGGYHVTGVQRRGVQVISAGYNYVNEEDDPSNRPV